jgi:hypothetical protein
MSIHRGIDHWLDADDVDAGCAASFEVLHIYVDAEAADGEPARSLPGIAAHLRTCPACREDYNGLVAAAELFGRADPL